VGKQFCKSFLKESISRANQALQEIHIDVYGPIKHVRLVKTYIFYFLLIFIVERLEYAF
jgi:hypothetical protein